MFHGLYSHKFEIGPLGFGGLGAAGAARAALEASEAVEEKGTLPGPPDPRVLRTLAVAMGGSRRCLPRPCQPRAPRVSHAKGLGLGSVEPVVRMNVSLRVHVELSIERDIRLSTGRFLRAPGVRRYADGRRRAEGKHLASQGRQGAGAT